MELGQPGDSDLSIYQKNKEFGCKGFVNGKV